MRKIDIGKEWVVEQSRPTQTVDTVRVWTKRFKLCGELLKETSKAYLYRNRATYTVAKGPHLLVLNGDRETIEAALDRHNAMWEHSRKYLEDHMLALAEIIHGIDEQAQSAAAFGNGPALNGVDHQSLF
jgi:hypothetical protein